MGTWPVWTRRRHLGIRGLLLLVALVFAGLIISIAVFVIMLLKGGQQQRAIEERKTQSLKLALELRQSSDDLTRFARIYAVTGDPKYEHYFQTILAIRDGKLAHPREFLPSYWDHVSARYCGTSP